MSGMIMRCVGRGGNMVADLLPIAEYQDLCKEIDILYMRIHQLENERKYYWKCVPNTEE